MPVTTPQINAVSTGTLTTALSNAFITPVPLDLHSETTPNGFPLTVTNLKFKLSAFYIYVTTIAGATTLTLQISSDADGDRMLIPATTATLVTGFTTAAKGSIVLRADVDTSLITDKIYYTLKTDAGTCVLDELIVCFDR
ncbi:hypothetical protein UFOVP1228_36 [uncultured Caudovirales phage]|uniref:Uncharacterized protein n=1 Tax=uncultured Caudovirales phage TaxID=2100421 RepID=A0A6J5SL11_9CAUD|nr:hypothetical protein UFOVP956_36 [uncultured Caudovirales phage]CAB4191467.1 hypothetical protein UFOVP1228_36 [uncultured Caudovirales phage]CAB4215246.1 hypothetical protein UFOVP1481_2 [uncultured Caudovirales phage]